VPAKVVAAVANMIRLSEAVARFRREEGAYSNAYDWYRRSAQRYGNAYIGGMDVPVHKERGAWYVNEEDLNRALAHHQRAVANRKAVTMDYDRHVLHGHPGVRVEMDWGYYQVADGFHCVSPKYEHPPVGSGTWYCTPCWRIAETEHDREECHTCSDWGSCGRDCTLSRVYCKVCGGSMQVG
jgi:hypothetical protein